MSPSRARYVTACQQLLALGVVVMALVPATRVVSLDVVGVGPGHGVAQPTIAVSPEAGVAASAHAGRGAVERAVGHRAERSVRVVERRSLARRTPAGAG